MHDGTHSCSKLTTTRWWCYNIRGAFAADTDGADRTAVSGTSSWGSVSRTMEEFRGPKRSMRMMMEVVMTAVSRWPPPQLTPMAAESQLVAPVVRPYVCWISRPSSSLKILPFHINAPAKKPIPFTMSAVMREESQSIGPSWKAKLEESVKQQAPRAVRDMERMPAGRSGLRRS
eukprot:CAMPEP_0117654296 /NCGR_PEP_ID=MMETSP0804-20121206/3668_1 /TAXON_ID=1074897 /ORGANISM="Tetraselmis astigmatica, Strain CCMP880" /LENGTH=173 /DNA_ID=CAMNT_0005460567 /DNA_START=232 /DNA_END=753 /DNA_ORIENTATION=+